MDDPYEFLDKSDDIRDELENFDGLSDIDSVHESDLDSEVCEEFERELRSEIDLPEQSDDDVNDSQPVEEVSNQVDDSGGGNDEERDDDDGWVEWSDNDARFHQFIWDNDSGYQPPRGPKPQTELEYFQLFFTDSLLTEIVNETNRYAEEKILKNTPLQKRSIWWSWKPVTLPEMKAFLGLLINMGMNPKPELDEYFSKDYIKYQPFYKDILSKVRFQQIFWNLHVSPPHNGPMGGFMSRSGKVRRVVLYLDRKYRQYYVPKERVSVDESTVGFKGKILFNVYNKDKPIKWGIKIFVVSESRTGYICGLEPYFGKQTTDLMDRQDLGVTSRIVLHLVKKLAEDYGSVEGLHVFTDRFYTNLDLAAALYDMKVHLTGTIMRNRKGLPSKVRQVRKKAARKRNSKGKDNTPARLKRGDSIAFRKDDKYSVVLWKDTNDVTMLSTLYDNSTQTVRRVKKKGVIEALTKPTVVCKYNENMGGVDLADQYISSYAFIRKSVKWWRKVFFLAF